MNLKFRLAAEKFNSHCRLKEDQEKVIKIT